MSTIPLLIKPWGMPHSQLILSRFDSRGTRVQTADIDSFTLVLISELYADKGEEPYFETMVADYVGQSGIAATYEGDLERFVEIKSQTRKEFDAGIPQETIHVRNSFHLPTTEAEAQRVLKVLEAYLRQ